MLRITADVFSGRENPSRVISHEAEARATLTELTRTRTLLTEAAPSGAGLGFRGFWIEPLSDELALDFQLGPSTYLAAGPSARDPRANEVAQRLIDVLERAETAPEAAAEVLPLEAPLREFLTTQLPPESRVTVADEGTAAQPEAEAAAAVRCLYELGAYNPGFWNNDASIRARNNCYNYASNKRTDTFAQPGRGCGHMYTAITCAEVTRGALCDGLHHRFDCFPDTEKPRYLIALVVAPGPGFIDFGTAGTGKASGATSPAAPPYAMSTIGAGSSPTRKRATAGHIHSSAAISIRAAVRGSAETALLDWSTRRGQPHPT